MDKENKDNVTASNASYDPDAAELLKDLEDEDEEDYQPAPTTSQANRSIVNILNSSSNLETLATIPSLPPVMPPQSAPAQISAPTDLACSADLSSPADISSELSTPECSDLTAPAEDSAKGEATQPPAPVQEAPAQTETAAVQETAEPAETAKPAIKPFEPKAAEIKSAESIKPADKKAKKKETAEPAPAKPEKVSEEAEATENKLQPHLTTAKKPPVPPPMPSPSMVCAGRVLREGEMIITQDILNDILPGGKNDEARDLAAFKFTDNNWYAQVFNEDYLRTVPQSSPRQTVREAKFIIDRLGIESGARVLDLCCGYGRHTLELAKKGFDMVGLDLSMVMLKKALADAQARGQAIKFVHGDMRKLSFKAIFDAIYNVQTSFGYFDDQSNFRVLQGVFNALKPGGVFLIETVNRDFIMNDLPLRLWWKGIDCTLLEEIDSEATTGLLKVQRSFVFDDNQRAPWEQKIQIRLYTANEMRALLTRAGFKVVELSGDYSLPGAYFGATSPKNIFVAEKPVK